MKNNEREAKAAAAKDVEFFNSEFSPAFCQYNVPVAQLIGRLNNLIKSNVK